MSASTSQNVYSNVKTQNANLKLAKLVQNCVHYDVQKGFKKYFFTNFKTVGHEFSIYNIQYIAPASYSFHEFWRCVCTYVCTYRDRYTVEITPAFRCTGLWPRSAAHWPQPPPPPTAGAPSWPSAALVADVKSEGFELLSKESPYAMTAGQRDKQTSADGDAWTISFHQVRAISTIAHLLFADN